MGQCFFIDLFMSEFLSNTCRLFHAEEPAGFVSLLPHLHGSHWWLGHTWRPLHACYHGAHLSRICMQSMDFLKMAEFLQQLQSPS